MTKMLKTGRNVILYILFTAIQVHARTKDPINVLKNLITRNNMKPIVVHYTSEKEASFINISADDGKRIAFQNLLAKSYDDGYTDGGTFEETAKDTAKNLFNNFLRSSPDVDPKLEETKQVLRQALRVRCKKVVTCITECKVEKPSCPVNCQKIFDDLNLCDTPKVDKCDEKRRGKTMPPKW